MKIQYRLDAELTPHQLSDLFSSSGIERPADDLERLETMLRNSNLTLTAWDGLQPVGIARALTDFSYACYLSDLAARHEYQRKGIGKELIQRMRSRLGGGVSLILLAAPAASGYYEALGFKRIERGWIIPREC